VLGSCVVFVGAVDMRIWWLLVPVCGLLGCSGLTTQPVQPGYTLTNVDAQCVRSLILANLTDQGFVVRSATDNQVIAGRPQIGGALGALVAPTDEHRVTVLMIPMGEGMRVVISEAFVSRAGSGFETSSPIYPGQGSFSMTGQGAQVQCTRR
jgi:hypothetical protein